jgi:hypothetical protein
LLYDYLFLSSNLFLLFSPIIFYFLNKYSLSLQNTLKQQLVEDDKKFHTQNSRFHILFKTVLILIAVFSISQLISVLVFNNELIKANSLIKIDFTFFMFVVSQATYLITNLFLIFFSFIYFRFKPSYRHHFIQKFFKFFTIFLFVEGLFGLILYFNLAINLSLPELLTYSSNTINSNLLVQNPLSYILVVIFFFIFTYTYRLFIKKRNPTTSRLYLLVYTITILIIAFLVFSFGFKYFEIFGVTSTSHILFHHTTFYVGIAVVYLFSLSFYGIIFAIFIYIKKSEFIGSQFAVSYLLKLANLNYYSTLGLVLIVIFPWVILEFYNYF